MKFTKQQVKSQNAYIYRFENGDEILVSYKTPVAVYFAEKFPSFYRTDTRYSVTTSRHINQYLAGAKAETMTAEALKKLFDERTADTAELF